MQHLIPIVVQVQWEYSCRLILNSSNKVIIIFYFNKYPILYYSKVQKKTSSFEIRDTFYVEYPAVKLLPYSNPSIQ